MTKHASSFLKLAISMAIFGSIGIFVRHIPVSSSMIALIRAVVGVLFLAAVLLLGKTRISIQAIRNNLVYLVLSGTAIGFNWILLFESYRFTSVAVSTLCYYMAPILVIVLSPVFLKERLTPKKLICVAVALAGMMCISGILESGIPGAGEMKGILLGLGAAVLYATVILLNKKFVAINAYEKTILQLGIAGLILIPYNLLTGNFSGLSLSGTTIILLAVVGIIHTGFAYFLYFGSMEFLPAQTIAITSYLDPVIAVIASVVLLKEPFSVANLIGAILILGAALISELPSRRKSA